jgi:hypothetical protein
MNPMALSSSSELTPVGGFIFRPSQLTLMMMSQAMAPARQDMSTLFNLFPIFLYTLVIEILFSSNV